MSYLFLIGMRPLSCRFDSDQTVFIRVGDACFWLEIRMFLNRDSIFAFHNYICLGKTGFHIAFADFVVDTDVGWADFSRARKTALQLTI